MITAGLAFVVGWGLEQRKRALDRKALASSILAEVEAVHRLLLHLRMEELYRANQAKMKEKLKAPDSEPWPTTPNDLMNFPVTVYEKCADRIGTLGADTAADVVSFYNFLNGFRINVKIALGDHDFPLKTRSQYIDFIVDMLAIERKKIKALQAKLRSIVAG